MFTFSSTVCNTSPPVCVCSHRYPYYALSVLGMEAKTLTWLRYTAWIPLYPVGFTCEGTVVVHTVSIALLQGDVYVYILLFFCQLLCCGCLFRTFESLEIFSWSYLIRTTSPSTSSRSYGSPFAPFLSVSCASFYAKFSLEKSLVRTRDEFGARARVPSKLLRVGVLFAN